MKGSSGLARRRMRLAATTLPVVVALLLAAPAAGASSKCETVRQCRAAASWHHSIRQTYAKRIATAEGRALPRKASAVSEIHSVQEGRLAVARAVKGEAWARATWAHVRSDNSVAGAERIVRYRFAPCGAEAQRRAHLIVGWESGWSRYNQNAAGDTGWWQIELPAHRDVSYAQATDAWESTGIAVRWSRCGSDFSPTWSAVRDNGQSWD